MNRKFWLIVLCAICLFACKHKKKPSLSGDEPITISDFIESFQPLELPFQFSDTSVNKKPKDTLLISYKVFTQFVPADVTAKVFGTNIKPKIYPMGRVSVPDKESYLFVKALNGDRKTVLIICFDRQDKFIAAMPALQPDANPATQQSFSIDKRLTISKIVTRKNADGTISDGKEVYVLNEQAKSFTLIMTDALDEKNVEVINPIDTFPRKNKFSADYTRDKKNLVSVRDNKKAGRISFFVHFEKNNGDCTGELKGEASFISPNVAAYRGAGEPCVLQFNFTSSSVTMTEIKGCGSYRGMDCVFEGVFPKKKEPKKPVKKIKK
jgi:hypothetical protein